MRRTAEANLKHQAALALPPSWLAALNDPERQRALAAAARHLAAAALAAREGGGEGHGRSAGSGGSGAGGALLCVGGGVGVEALHLTAAATAAAAAAAAAGAGIANGSHPHIVPPRVVFEAPNTLALALAQQLAAANGVGGGGALACTLPGREQERGGDGGASEGIEGVLLAGALSPRWEDVVDATRRLRQLLAAAATDATAPPPAVSPLAVRVRVAPAQCAGLLALNEVDAAALSADADAGAVVDGGGGDGGGDNDSGGSGLEFGAAARALRRATRPAQVARYAPRWLAAPVTALELDLARLAETAASGGSSGGDGDANGSSAAAETEEAAEMAALMANAAAAPVEFEAARDGAADCLVAWLDFEGAPGVWLSHAPAGVDGDGIEAASASAADDVLRPHRWQTVHFLPAAEAEAGDAIAAGGAPVRQGAHIRAGERLRLEARASARGVALRLLRAGGAAAPHAAAATDEEQQTAAAAALVSAAAAAGQAFHAAMLNDRARNRAYAAGVRGAVAETAALAAEQRGGGGGGGGEEGGDDGSAAAPPVVLDIGSGSGLLAMIAARAGAPCVVGERCEGGQRGFVCTAHTHTHTHKHRLHQNPPP